MNHILIKMGVSLSVLLGLGSPFTVLAGETTAASPTPTAETARTVKVAFPYESGMSEVDANGNYAGYTYDYLSRVSERTGWNLEYVTYNGSSLDEGIMSAMTAVMNGEADLIGPILKNNSTEQLFDFPEKSYGTVYTTLCAKDDGRVLESNFKEFEPLKIALIRNATSRNSEVTTFLDNEGVQYEITYCDTTEEQQSLLADGTVDAVSGLTLSYFTDTVQVAEFSPRPYYFVTTKGKNADLLSELDDAITNINYTEPHLQHQLNQEYFSDVSGSVNVNDRQKQVLQDMGTLNVIAVRGNAPYSYEDSDGNAAGMLVSLLNDFADQVGVSIDYTFCDTVDDLTFILASTDQYELVLDMPSSFKYCSENGLIQSETITDTPVSYFSLTASSGSTENQTAAVYAGLIDEIDESQYKNVIVCNTTQECIKAVQSKEADIGIGNRVVVDYYLYDCDVTMFQTTSIGLSQSICIGVNKNADIELNALLNKYIYSLDDTAKTSYLRTAEVHESTNALGRYLNKHPEIIWMTVTILALMMLIIVLTSRYSARLKKQNEELVKANASKTDFLSSMSHDIRTPMNAIIGFTGMALEKEKDNPEVSEDLKHIDSSSRFLLGLINDVLDMSKIENSSMTLHPEPYPLVEFNSTLLSVITPQCEKKHIAFTIIDPDIPVTIIADRLRLNQIAINLLGNAVKFTPENGHITLKGEYLNKTADRLTLSYTVTDDGIGMSEEFQKHLFEPFTQEHAAGAEENEGTGLGLSIVYRLVHMMGGTITCRSAQGKGTEFNFRIPFEISHEEIKKRIDRSDTAYTSLDGKHILLCEDNSLNTEITVHLLEKEGMRVDTAVNGKEGLELYLKNPSSYDAILMDIRMPVMDGLEASRKIRASSCENARSIPIIALTANAFDEDVQKSREAGINEHISKPIDNEKLYDTLSRCIAKKA
ncbi:MAG: ATP-binding protein [Solobacterium sp.]|nr:ATP-binding protein [Solobacterium sp.]MCH4222655.1 ATP-binding protein [Solobacterium sp.]MCH4265143.1 ATP-binding protein [Solobacterium sp.]